MKKLTRTFKNGKGDEYLATITIAEEGSEVFERTVLELTNKALGNRQRCGQSSSSIHNGFMTVVVERIGP